MKKMYYLLMGVLYSQMCVAQSQVFMNTNDIRATINTSTVLFNNNTTAAAGFEAPKGFYTHSIYASNFWLSGLDTLQNKIAIGNTFENTGWRNGPYTTIEDSARQSMYNRLWRITKYMVDNHQQNFNNPGYVIPEVIRNWPADGDTTYGESENLAPYHDLNKNGIYDPQFGDYPIILGDESILTIFNNRNHSSGLEVEVYRMVYAYDSPELDQSIFVNYRVINKSNQTFTNFRFSNWIEFELGGFFDDYISSIPNKNAVAVYNGDNYDEDGFNNTVGYGPNPPACGVKFLNKTMASSIFYVFGGSATGEPSLMIDYYNYSNATWLDNEHLVFGGDGRASGTGDPNQETNFMYPDHPNGNGWHESSAGNDPGDRRMVMSSEGMSFAPEDKICFDLVYTYARNNNPGTENNPGYNALLNSFDEVQNQYDNNLSSLCNTPIGDSVLIQADVYQICENNEVTFTFLTNGIQPTNIQWTFANGVPDSHTGLTPPPITYTMAGSYPVSAVIEYQNQTQLTLTNTNFIHVVSPNATPSVDSIAVSNVNECKTLVTLNPANPVIYSLNPTYEYHHETDGLIHRSDNGYFVLDQGEYQNGEVITLHLIESEVCGEIKSASIEKIIDFFKNEPVIEEISPGVLGIPNISGASTYQWYFEMPSGNLFLISGATDSTYSYPRNGTYVVDVSYFEGCTSFSESYVVSETRVAENKLQDILLRISPNPSNGNAVTITLNTILNKGRLEVLNNLGQTVYNQSIVNKTTFTLPTYQLKKGVYTVKIHDAVSMTTKQFVVN